VSHVTCHTPDPTDYPRTIPDMSEAEVGEATFARVGSRQQQLLHTAALCMPAGAAPVMRHMFIESMVGDQPLTTVGQETSTQIGSVNPTAASVRDGVCLWCLGHLDSLFTAVSLAWLLAYEQPGQAPDLDMNELAAQAGNTATKSKLLLLLLLMHNLCH